jgi:Mrp family chromosome partitioning ATPase
MIQRTDRPFAWARSWPSALQISDAIGDATRSFRERIARGLPPIGAWPPASPRQNDATLNFGEIAGRVFASLQARRSRGEGAAPAVVVTSALAGEGKSFVAEGLALHMAALGSHRIMLMDANPARPTITAHFQKTSRAGFMDLMRGDAASMGELALEPAFAGIDNLAVLGIGRRPEAALLFRDGGAGRLLGWAGRHCELLILDGGPLSEPGASVLTDLATKNILVIDSQRTPRGEISSALDSVRQGGQSWGVVLNKRLPVGPKFLERA